MHTHTLSLSLHLSLGKKQKNAHIASSCGSRVYCKPTHPFDTISPLSYFVLFSHPEYRKHGERGTTHMETDNKRGTQKAANCMKCSKRERQNEKKMGEECTRWWRWRLCVEGEGECKIVEK